MKYKKLFFLIFLIYFSKFTFSQEEITYSFKNVYEEPFSLKKNDKVLILSDEAYLINKNRLLLYEEAKSAVLNMNYGTANTLLKEYENSLKISQKAYDDLYKKYEKANADCQNTISVTQKTLESQSKFLEETKKSLKKASEELEGAEKNLKKEKRKGFFKNLVWAGSGVIVGVLLSVIL